MKPAIVALFLLASICAVCLGVFVAVLNAGV